MNCCPFVSCCYCLDFFGTYVMDGRKNAMYKGYVTTWLSIKRWMVRSGMWLTMIPLRQCMSSNQGRVAMPKPMLCNDGIGMATFYFVFFFSLGTLFWGGKTQSLMLPCSSKCWWRFFFVISSRGVVCVCPWRRSRLCNPLHDMEVWTE